MDYIGTNSQGTANAPNGMSDQLLGTWFQPGFPFLGAGHCAILPWPHVRNQEKRFPREHFTLLVRKSDLLVSISLLLVRKSDLLVSISLLLVSKSDLLASISLLLTNAISSLPTNRRRFPTICSPSRGPPYGPKMRIGGPKGAEPDRWHDSLPRCEPVWIHFHFWSFRLPVGLTCGNTKSSNIYLRKIASFESRSATDTYDSLRISVAALP